MRHDADSPNIIDGYDIDFLVISLADCLVDLPANTSKTVDANSNSHKLSFLP